MAVIDGFKINGTDYDLRDAVAVRFNEAQTMTDAQKAQARSNIDAVSTSDQNTLSGNVVHVDAVQPLNDAQKQTARDNIGAVSTEDVDEALNYYTETELTASAAPEGWKLDGTGKCTQDTSYKLVKYEVTPGDTLHLKLSKDSGGVYQWQSSASVPSSLPNNKLVGTPATTAIDGNVDVPVGATYLIVSQYKTNTTNSVKVMTPAGTIKDAIQDIEIDDRLLNSMIKGTRQVVVKTGGKVTGVNHIDGSNHTVRSDTFAVDSDPMVETRTLDTGERLTISTDLTTLTSTITYTPASA